MRGSNWTHALGGSERETVGLETLAAGNRSRPATASDSRTIEEFMQPDPVEKQQKDKKRLDKKKLTIAQQETRNRRAAARRAEAQKKTNPLLGRRKEWPYVETLKSRREESKATGMQGGAKAARDAVQNVAFWPHCRWDKKAFVLDMPSSSNTAKG